MGKLKPRFQYNFKNCSYLNVTYTDIRKSMDSIKPARKTVGSEVFRRSGPVSEILITIAELLPSKMSPWVQKPRLDASQPGSWTDSRWNGISVSQSVESNYVRNILKNFNIVRSENSIFEGTSKCCSPQFIWNSVMISRTQLITAGDSSNY